MEIWSTFVGGLLALLGALGGAILTHRLTTRLAAQQLVEAHRQRLYELVSDLITDAEAMLDSAWVLIPMYAKMTSRDLMEFVDTDTGKEGRERSRRLQATLVRLRLLANGTPLESHLQEFRQYLDQWADKANGALALPHTDAVGRMQAVEVGFEHVRRTRSVLRGIENAASTLFVRPLT